MITIILADEKHLYILNFDLQEMNRYLCTRLISQIERGIIIIYYYVYMFTYNAMYTIVFTVHAHACRQFQFQYNVSFGA